MTVRDALGGAVPALRAAGCETPELDAQLLIADALGVDRAAVLAEPGRAVPHAARALRPGGIIMVYLPTTIQVHQAVMALVEHPDFGLIEAFETLHRPWDISRMSMRPAHRMVAHTGFIIVARRVVGPVPDKSGTLPGEPP